MNALPCWYHQAFEKDAGNCLNRAASDYQEVEVTIWEVEVTSWEVGKLASGLWQVRTFCKEVWTF